MTPNRRSRKGVAILEPTKIFSLVLSMTATVVIIVEHNPLISDLFTASVLDETLPSKILCR